jgi:hypothetical protein
VNPLWQIKQGLGRLARGISGLPDYFARDDELRREEEVREELEAERLDRIRNPHKYRCR